MLTGDTLVYLLLALLVWGTWRISLLGLFTPGDNTGYWLGVVGSVMMLVLLSYPLRKYMRFARNWGNIKGWFWLHIILGVFGPLLILLHSNFQTGSLNAAVALYSMLLVAGSAHAVRGLGVPTHLPPALRFSVLLAVAGPPDAAATPRAADLVWETAPVPPKDYCAELRRLPPMTR